LGHLLRRLPSFIFFNLRHKKDLEREYIEEAVESIYEMRILWEISKESVKRGSQFGS
jgi:hypothetical protein